MRQRVREKRTEISGEEGKKGGRSRKWRRRRGKGQERRRGG